MHEKLREQQIQQLECAIPLSVLVRKKQTYGDILATKKPTRDPLWIS